MQDTPCYPSSSPPTAPTTLPQAVASKYHQTTSPGTMLPSEEECVRGVDLTKRFSQTDDINSENPNTTQVESEEEEIDIVNTNVQENLNQKEGKELCSLCHAIFLTVNELNIHLFGVHGMLLSTNNCGTSSYGSDTSSDGSTNLDSELPFKRRKIMRTSEYNNNIEMTPSSNGKKRKADIDVVNVDNKKRVFECSVCDETGFSSVSLETHLAECHKEFTAKDKCNICFLNFKNHQDLSMHQLMFHQKNKDMFEFNDVKLFGYFEKLHIASPIEEGSLHQSQSALKTPQQFDIENYTSDKDSLQQDEELSSSYQESLTDVSGESRSESSDLSENEKEKDTFLAIFNLQNNSVQNIVTDPHVSQLKDRLRNKTNFKSNSSECKDLADIQSMISVSSVQGLLPDLPKSPLPSTIEITPPDSKPKADLEDSAITDEEDPFAEKLREMKRKGKFPCGLCDAVFKNLRKVKGHNKVHMSQSNGSKENPYRCNLCPYFSSEKNALVRHMRTHNGYRAFLCAKCHFAFTTRANCERHLRNKHKKNNIKLTRAQAKELVIYRPPKVRSKKEQKPNRNDVKRSLFGEKSMPLEEKEAEKVVSTTTAVIEPIQSLIPSTSNYVSKRICEDQVNKEIRLTENINPYKETQPICSFTADIDCKNEVEGDGPLDLTMDVLDLSKKKTNEDQYSSCVKNTYESDDIKPQDLSKKTVSTSEHSHPVHIDALATARQLPHHMPLKEPTSSGYLFDRGTPVQANQALLPQFDISTMYSLTTHQLYLKNIHIPYFPTAFPSEPVTYNPEILKKELMSSLTHNSHMMNHIAMTNAGEITHQNNFADMKWRIENSKEESKTPFSSHKDFPFNTQLTHPESENIMKSHDLNQPNTSQNLTLSKPKQDSSSVKMVIKNGVLIPKQKQRRYRTERPFQCVHCAAKFTLRSNMERHVKQQHPEFWSQRQRNATNMTNKRNNTIAKPSNTPINHGQFTSTSGVFSFKSEDELSRSSLTNTKSFTPDCKSFISKEVKNAIITQQLKSKNSATDTNNEDNLVNEDKYLVIDEGVKDETNTDEKNNDGERKKMPLNEETQDLASVPRLINNLDNVSSQTFPQYFHSDEDQHMSDRSEEEEEGLVAAGSTSESCNSGSDENRSEPENANKANPSTDKKKSAYSLAPNRVYCPECSRSFPWISSLNRHLLTHTGQKPFRCTYCPRLFTTKSNRERHLLRKHSDDICISMAEHMTTNDATTSNHSASRYTMRNVPERPFKCKICPSSTFSTLSNLKKHLSKKHSSSITKVERAQGGYESHYSRSEENYVSKNEHTKIDLNKEKKNVSDLKELQPGHSPDISMKTNTIHVEQTFVATPPSDLPFKCHLCECSFSKRQEAKDHIRTNHFDEYLLIIAKKGERAETFKKQFPKYNNRKVMCAFCLLRFWSAEDLRRHMRTHTGKRPFACDLCLQRFTLKHSMVRHRKKHTPNSMTKVISPARVLNATNMRNNNTTSKPWMKSRIEEESDLISNLLGIQDKTIVDQMLISKSADDAAKLLGVQK